MNKNIKANPIPPGSVVELYRADSEAPLWKKEIGKQFRIGYYSKQDGLDVIWLVDEKGDYCQATDHEFLYKYFRIIQLSSRKDYFGYRSKPFGPLYTQKKLIKNKV